MNRYRRSFTLSMVALLVLSALPAFAPPAQAASQGDVSISATCSPSAGSFNQCDNTNQFKIMPIAGSKKVVAGFEVSANTGATSPITAVKVSIVNPNDIADSYSWLNVAPGATEKVVPVSTSSSDGEAAGDWTKTVSFPFLVTANNDEPALSTVSDVTIEVEVQGCGSTSSPDQSPCTLATDSTSTSITFQTDYFDITTFEVPQSIFTPPPSQRMSFPLTIVNQGNGRSEYTVDRELSGQSAGWAVTLSTRSKVVDPPQAGENRNRGTLTVSVLPPQETRYYSDLGIVTFAATPQPDIATQTYNTTTAKIDLGFYYQGVVVPGFEAPMAGLGAVAALALLAIRRRRELE